MTTATATLPTDAQLRAVYNLNAALNDMEQQFPSFINGDRASDTISAAIGNLNLPLNEDEDNAQEVFWTLCEERGVC